MSEKHIYTIFDPQGNALEHVSITGQDIDNCTEQVDQYLNTKQGCYAFEDDEYEHDSDWDYEADDNSYGTAKWS